MKSLLAPLATFFAGTTAALLASAPVFASPSLDRNEVRVTWNDKRYTPDTLPEEIGESPRTTMEFWRPWAEEHGYQMAFNDDARVLLLTSKKRSPKKALKLIDKTTNVLEEIAPLDAPRPAVSERKEQAEPKADPGVAAEGTSWTWEDTGPPLGTQTAVVVEMYGILEYVDALDRLADAYDYLAPWVGSAQGMSGFTLQRPLCAAFLKDGPGSEEWDPENEIVHRTARLLLLREFGRQPTWLSSGLAWYVEDAVRDTLYCFPYRDGFVGVTEHTGWDKELKRMVKKRDRVRMDELTSFERGTFDRTRAMYAFGAATFLAEHHAEELPGILEELQATIHRDGRTHHDDGTWTLIPDYEPPAETQQAILAKHLGPDWIDELYQSYRKGRSYRP